MIDKQIAKLNKLRDQLIKDSCLPKEPFIKLGAGTPTLNYNLPQSACFSTYGDTQITLQANVFKPECLAIPPNNYFDLISKADPISLQNQMNEAVQLQNTSSPLIANVGLLRNNLDMSKTNLEAIALGEPIIQQEAKVTDSLLIPNPIGNDTIVSGLNTPINPNIFDTTYGLPGTGTTSNQAIKPKIVEQTNAINEFQLARLATQGFMQVITEKLAGFGTQYCVYTYYNQNNINL